MERFGNGELLKSRKQPIIAVFSTDLAAAAVCQNMLKTSAVMYRCIYMKQCVQSLASFSRVFGKPALMVADGDCGRLDEFLCDASNQPFFSDVPCIVVYSDENPNPPCCTDKSAVAVKISESGEELLPIIGKIADELL